MIVAYVFTHSLRFIMRNCCQCISACNVQVYESEESDHETVLLRPTTHASSFVNTKSSRCL